MECCFAGQAGPYEAPSCNRGYQSSSARHTHSPMMMKPPSPQTSNPRLQFGEPSVLHSKMGALLLLHWPDLSLSAAPLRRQNGHQSARQQADKQGPREVLPAKTLYYVLVLLAREGHRAEDREYLVRWAMQCEQSARYSLYARSIGLRRCLISLIYNPS